VLPARQPSKLRGRAYDADEPLLRNYDNTGTVSAHRVPFVHLASIRAEDPDLVQWDPSMPPLEVVALWDQ